MQVDEKRIASRVEARSAADLLIEMAIMEAGNYPDDAGLALWERLRDAALERAPLPVVVVRRGPEPMTEAQAREFEKVPMPFGKYEGTPVGDVYEEDPGYLDWLLNGDDFKVQLNRYLLTDSSVRDLDED